MADTITLTRTQLEEYVQQGVLSGKLSAIDEIAAYVGRSSLDAFQEGKDQAAAALRDLGIQLRSEAATVNSSIQTIVDKRNSSGRRGKIDEAAAEITSNLNVGDEEAFVG